mgnify:CR=1 FL=1
MPRLLLVGAPGLGLRSNRLALTSWRQQATEEGRRAAHRGNLATLMLYRDEAIDDLAVDLQATNVPRHRMQRRKLALTDILLHTLPAIRCPLFALYGANDALYRDTLPALQAALRTAPTLQELVLLPGAGHWVQYEAPEAVNREVLRLLPA